MGFATMTTTTLLLLSAAFVCALEEPVKGFCRRFDHQSAVIDDRLYINGGQTNSEFNPKNVTNDRLLYHDLTKIKEGMPPLMSGLNKGSEVPSLDGGVLWADEINRYLYQFGGDWPSDSEPTGGFGKGWKYDVDADSWSDFSIPKNIPEVSFGAGAVSESTGKGYYMGGWTSVRNKFGWTGPKHASNSLLSYDMVNNDWNSILATDRAGRAEGGLFWIPAGDNGMLIYFGGVRSSNGNAENAEPVDMNYIDIIDARSETWYQFNATGATPEKRGRFCGGVSSAADGSSHNIYIFGGQGFGNETVGFDDVYILTIPTFTWIKAWPNVPLTGPDLRPHYGLSCDVVRGSQMLIIGGVFPLDMEIKTCDAGESSGVHDLWLSTDSNNTKVWSEYNPKTSDYKVPPQILEVVGGSEDGGATKKTPAKSLGYDLGSLFEIPYQTPHRKSTRPKSNNTRRLLIIILPTVLGTAFILCVILYLLRWHRQRHQPAELPANESQSVPYEPPKPETPPPPTAESQYHVSLPRSRANTYQSHSDIPAVELSAEYPITTPISSPGLLSDWPTPPLGAQQESRQEMLEVKRPGGPGGPVSPTEPEEKHPALRQSMI